MEGVHLWADFWDGTETELRNWNENWGNQICLHIYGW